MKNKGFIKGALCGALAVLLIMSCVSCGVITSGIKYVIKKKVASQNPSKTERVVSSAAESKLEYLEKLIETYYIGEIDKEALTEGIYKGYIEALDDPYTVYYDSEETEKYLESITGEYSGIGAVLSQDPDSGIITILQVYPDSPAKEVGLKDNDTLYKVAGEEVTGNDLTEVVSHIRGEEGTQVELTVLRGENGEEITVMATRRKIKAFTVSYEMKEDQIGYIRITEFDSVTFDQYKEALEDLESQGMKALVVDLRSNPGGSLDVVTDILDLMLPKGTVVSMKEKSGQVTEYPSDEAHKFTKPLAVLVNGYSASASEIYAGAIQDFKAGDIIGTQTYGKGVVQQIFDLQDGSSVKITIADYYTPSGRNIHGEGIAPDIEIEYEEDPENPDYDNQLEKALEILRNKL